MLEPETERAYLRCLLAIREPSPPGASIDRALALLVALTGATTGYVELEANDGAAPPFLSASGEGAPSVCRGAIGRAIGGTHALVVASARTDPRFAELASVRAHRIGALACAPVTTWSATGVVYLHRAERTDLSRACSAAELERFELLAREVRAVADRLVLGDVPRLRDATRRLHEHLVVEALLRTGWNVTRAARALGVTRTFVYAVARSAGARRGA